MLLFLCQSGIGKLLVDTLNGTSFTIIGDNSDLNWAVAQVYRTEHCVVERKTKGGTWNCCNALYLSSIARVKPSVIIPCLDVYMAKVSLPSILGYIFICVKLVPPPSLYISVLYTLVT